MYIFVLSCYMYEYMFFTLYAVCVDIYSCAHTVVHRQRWQRIFLAWRSIKSPMQEFRLLWQSALQRPRPFGSRSWREAKCRLECRLGCKAPATFPVSQKLFRCAPTQEIAGGGCREMVSPSNSPTRTYDLTHVTHFFMLSLIQQSNTHCNYAPLPFLFTWCVLCISLTVFGCRRTSQSTCFREELLLYIYTHIYIYIYIYTDIGKYIYMYVNI